MKDPPRLLDSPIEPFTRAMLGSAQRDKGSARAQTRCVAAVSTAVGIAAHTASSAAATTAATTASAVSVSLGPALAIKGIVIGVVMGVAAQGAIQGVVVAKAHFAPSPAVSELSRAERSSPSRGERSEFVNTATTRGAMAGAAVPQPLAAEAVAETVRVAERQGSADRPGLALPPVRVERSGSVPSGSDREVLVEPEQQAEPSAAATPAPPNDALEREVRLLDQVRARCSAAQYSQALALLDLHRQKFDGGALGPEALVLRVQALLGEGRRAEAQSVAKPYLASNRESSISKRLIALLGNGISAR